MVLWRGTLVQVQHHLTFGRADGTVVPWCSTGPTPFDLEVQMVPNTRCSRIATSQSFIQVVIQVIECYMQVNLVGYYATSIYVTNHLYFFKAVKQICKAARI